ncbi:MAG: dihydrodipicolinate synthase family protein [Aquamicrobium sp.]|nr:dihydrodipicolinate synthase family protein [Aquamicrobium sp.]
MKYDRAGAAAWVRSNLKGYMTALYTPFDTDGAIDFSGLRANVRRTMDLPGVGGISVNTLHQEYWTLTTDERRRLVEATIDEVAGRMPVIVGCTDPSWKATADFCRHAQSAGADLVMVWPSYYGPRDASGVRAYYEAVAADLDVGMLVYSTTLSELGYYLDPSQVADLLHIPNICGVQNTTLNLAQYASMLRAVGDRLPVATSLEEYFFFGKSAFPDATPDFMIGSSRPIFCQTRDRPHCGRFFDAMMSGRHDEAAVHMRTILAIAEKLQSRYFASGFHHVGLFKALAGRLGMVTGPVRAPIARPGPEELRECLAVLASEGLIDADRPNAT